MRILFAWEMGRNFGHVAQIADIASQFAANDAEVFLALQTPAAGVTFLNMDGVHLLQAPFHPVRRSGPRIKPLVYSDDLLPCGYDSVDNLYPLIACWRSLFDVVLPDVLVAQAAPTALLASRGAGFPRVAIGRSYDIPPLTNPQMPLRYWEKNDPEELKKRESATLATINGSLKRAGIKPLGHLMEMLEADRQFLCTVKELDHYPDRPDGVYYGSFSKTDSGFEIDWNKDAEKRIFAYLRPDHAVFHACMEALRHAPPKYDVIVAAPGLPEGECVQLSKPHVRIVNKAVRLDKLLPRCDLGINYAGSGLCSALALAGVPVLMFPQHIEQVMFARAMGRNGFGMAMIGRPAPPQIAKGIQRLLTDQKFSSAVGAFKRKYEGGSNPGTVSLRIVNEISELVN